MIRSRPARMSTASASSSTWGHVRVSSCCCCGSAPNGRTCSNPNRGGRRLRGRRGRAPDRPQRSGGRWSGRPEAALPRRRCCAPHQCAARNDMCAPTTTGPTRPSGSTHASPGWTTWLDTTARAAKTAQTQLGEHHDSVLTRSVLRELGVQAQLDGDSAFTFGMLYGLEQWRASAPRRVQADLDHQGVEAPTHPREVDHYRDCGGVQ